MQNCYWMTPLARSADVLLRHLPLGRAWLGFRTKTKRGYRMITGLAGPYEDAWSALCTLATELNPYATTDLITDWERAVGLPDACLPTATTIEQRRALVVYRLSKRRWTTAQDWKDIATLFGLTIKITPGWQVQKPALYAFCYPKRYDLFPRLGRFRVYIDILSGCTVGGYAYAYPASYTTGQGDCAAFICLINRVCPANVVIIWNSTPSICGS